MTKRWFLLDCEDYLGVERFSSSPQQCLELFQKRASVFYPEENEDERAQSWYFQSKMETKTEIFVSLLLFMVPGCLLWVPVLLLLLLCSTHWLFFLVGLLSTLTVIVMPVKQWIGIYDHWICDLIFQFFSFKFVWPEEFDLSKPCLFVGVPHGVFPFGHVLNLIFVNRYLNYPLTGVSASVVLRVPLLRQVLLWMGCQEASASQLRLLLEKEHPIGLSSGGIAELFESRKESTRETVFLQERKGFVKLALQTGTPLVPFYIFGQTEVMECLNHSSLQKFSRMIRASLTLFWGRYYLPMPHRCPLVSVVGKTIHVPKIEYPTQEDVDRYHQIFVEEVISLFETHKRNYGWAEKALILKQYSL